MTTSTNKMKRLSVLGIFLLTALFAFQPLQAQKKKYQSLLWEISGNNLEKPSYLYGTMHVSKKIAFHLSDTFFMGIENADVIALETNPNNWMDEYLGSDLLKVAYSFMGGFGTSGSGIYSDVFPFEAPDNMQLGAALAFESNLMNSMLYRFSPGNQDFEENTYLDLFIYQAAKKQGKGVVGIEDFKKTMMLSIKASIPTKEDREKKRKYMSYTERIELGQKINDAYRRGDLDLLDSLSDLTNPTVNYRKYMLDIRNRGMVNNIDSILAHNSMFIGVGAAHLPGDSGVIEMLRMKGYKLRAVDRTVTKSSRKKMKEILAYKAAIPYQLEHSGDSAFSVLMPGKMYVVPSLTGSVSYFNPDMTNGASYTVSRIQTFGAYYGKTPQDYILKLDSLLYENLPGDIQGEREEIVVDGHAGFDIKIVSKRGDEQRYRILVTPFEILIFKVGNSGKFTRTNKKEIDKMMESISIAPYKSGWSKFSPLYGEYEFEIPNMRLINNGDPLEKESSTYEVQAIDKDDQGFYYFKNKSLYDFDYIEEDTFELNQFVEQYAEEMKLTIQNRERGTYLSFPSINAAYKTNTEDSSNVYARFIMRGNEYYMLMAKTQDVAKAEKYFNSLKFTPYEYEGEFEERTDSALFFTVKVVDITPENSFRSLIPKLQYQMYELEEDEDEEDRSYYSDTKYATFSTLTTGEKINVKYYQYNYFSSADSLHKYWEYRSEALRDWDKFYEIERDTFSTDSTFEMNLVYGDSASSKTVRARLILYHGVLYTLTSPQDTLQEPSLFVKTFFESFRPSCDTMVGMSIFDNKNDLWFSYMKSGDSLAKQDSIHRQWAVNSTSYLDLEDEEAPKLIELYKNFKYKDQPTWLKSRLIQEIGSLEHEDVIPFLKATYPKIESNTELQYTVLEELADSEKEEAFTFIKNQLLEEPPLSDESDVWSLFSHFADSLELCKQFYPAFYDLTTYPEYEKPVYHLLRVMLDSGVITSDLYKSQISTITRKANNELRRQLAGEEETTETYSYNYDNYNKNSYRYESSYDYDGYYGGYTGASFLNRTEYADIMDYIKLLTPYKDDAKVKTLLEKLLNIKEDDFKVDLVAHYLKEGISVPDTTLENLVKNNSSRYDFYRALEELELTEHFDKAYLNHDSLIMSKLYGSYYDDENDSIIFLEKRYQQNRYGDGYVYIYKSKKEDDDEWVFDYVYLVPKDSADFDYDDVRFIRDFADLEATTEKEIEEEYKEETKKMMQRARFKGRERVSYKSEYDYGGIFGY